MTYINKIVFSLGLVAIIMISIPVLSQQATPETKPPRPLIPDMAFEGDMTLERMNTILKRLDKDLTQSRKGVWQFKIETVPVILVSDEANDRMRIVIGIKKADALSRVELIRLSQANFDSALDARYAIAKGVLWAVYIHPLRALHDKQFISAIGQTINIAKEYGRTYSSGALVYGGGDSEAIQKNLIEKLQKKGLDI